MLSENYTENIVTHSNGSSNGIDMASTDVCKFIEVYRETNFSILFSVTMDYTKFEYGAKLRLSQIKAMSIKKFLYSIRNYILLIIQFVIPALFVVITMLSESALTGNLDLPELAISFDEYIQTVTTAEKGSFGVGSTMGNIFESYENSFKNLPPEHQLRVTEKDFQQEILDQYRTSLSKTNLNYMVGVSFRADNVITAWFNNQGYHTAPLTINLINNAILK